MRAVPKKALSLAILASISVASCWAPDAGAADIQSVLTSLADVDAREAQIERRLGDAIGSGRLTPNEATNFKHELDRIQESEANYRATNGLSAWEVLRLTLDLDNLSRALELQMRDRQVSSGDLNARKAEIERRINEGLAHSRLTLAESEQLKREFSRINALEEHFRSDGTLSSEDALTLSLDLDRLSNRVERQLSDRGTDMPDLDARLAEITKTVDDGVATGKLTAAQASEYKTELARLESLKRMHRESGGVLTLEEALTVGLDLDRLNGRLDLALKNPAVATDVDARQKDLDHRIASGISEGKLTPQEAVELEREYDRIVTLEATLRASGNLLTYDESAVLSLDLERLSARIQRAMHDPGETWLGTAAVQTQIAKRISDAQTAGRLSQVETQDLRTEFDRLAAVEAAQHASADGLTAGEAVLLAIDFQKLSSRIDRTLHDRDVSVPPFDGRQAEVDRRIAEGIASGKLTPGQARDLKAEFDRIAAQEASFLVSDSRLDSRELLQLSYDLERLASRSERLIRDSQTSEGLAALRNRVDGAITRGYAGGVLTQAERNQYFAEFDRLKAAETTYRNSGDMLSTEEALLLVTDLYRLAGQVEQESKQAAVNVPNLEKRRGELELRIGKGVTTGYLTATDAQILRIELDRIASEEQRARRTDGGLSYGESINLGLQLERLASRIERQMRDQQIALPNTDARLQGLEMQIAAALVSGRLTAQEAQTLRVGLDEVVTVSARYKSSGDGLSYAEAVSLSSDLDRLTNDVNATLRGKQMTGADLDQRQLTLEKRINEARAAKLLTPAVAANLLAELDRVAESESAFRVSDEGINYMEALTLALDLDRVQGKIDRALDKRVTVLSPVAAASGLTARKGHLRQRLNQGVASGRIAAKDAAPLEVEWQRIAKLEAAYRAKGTLTAAQMASLSADLDRLSARIEQQFVYRTAR